MQVREEFQIVADQKEMEELFVHDLEALHRLSRFGIKHAKIERDFASRWNLRRRGAELHRVLDWHWQSRHQLHAASRTPARSFGAHLAIHRTNEFRLGVLRAKQKACARDPRAARKGRHVSIVPEERSLTVAPL